MRKFFLRFTLVVLIIYPFTASAGSLSASLSGRILLNVEGNGEAWYVNPVNHLRYYLGRPEDAFSIMRQLGLGIKEIDFQRIAQAGMPITGDLALARRLAGRIVLETEKNGEAWYINPVDLKKYFLGRPADAFKIMRELSLGVTKVNLAAIHKPANSESIDQYSSYEHKIIKTTAGDFTIDIITIDLRNPNLKIITSTADDYNCKADCNAKPLASYIKETGAFAAINGTYFDTSSAKKNYYFFPVYNSVSGKFINEDQLKWWTTGPIIAFDQDNKFYYFKDSRDFKSVADFESKFNVKLVAAIGNKPRIIENYLNVLIDWEVDEKQATGKSYKNALAYKEGKLYLINVHNATVPDLGIVLQGLGMEYAINLDGGYSTAMFYNDEFMVGPGRDVPNALLFSLKK